MSDGREVIGKAATTNDGWTAIQLNLSVLHASSGPVENREPMYKPSRMQLHNDTPVMLQIPLSCECALL